MTSRSWSLILLSSCLAVAAVFLLRLGLERAGGLSGYLRDFSGVLGRLVSEPVFMTGVLFYGLATVLWFHIITTDPLGTASAVLVSITLVLVILGASVLFNEPITLLKIVGLAVILSGIAMISYQ